MKDPYPDPRWGPPPLTGFRPDFVREDEWLNYAFGYDERETDSWIVPRNSEDVRQLPLWIGSKCRSRHLTDSPAFMRSCDSPDRFYNFRLGWQDPDDPLTVHELGGFQMDLQGWGERSSDRFRRSSIAIQEWNDQVVIVLDDWTRYELGSPRKPNPGHQSHRISHFLAHEVLGKTVAEVFVHFLHQDERLRKIERKRQSPSKNHESFLSPTEERNFLLTHAWDNHSGDPELYSAFRGRLGMHTLAE